MTTYGLVRVMILLGWLLLGILALIDRLDKGGQRKPPKNRRKGP